MLFFLKTFSQIQQFLFFSFFQRPYFTSIHIVLIMQKYILSILYKRHPLTECGETLSRCIISHRPRPSSPDSSFMHNAGRESLRQFLNTFYIYLHSSMPYYLPLFFLLYLLQFCYSD